MIWGGQQAVPALSGGMLLLLSLLLLVVGYRMGKRARAPRWLPWLTGLGAALLPTAVVRAATFTVPVVFSNGTIADAKQVNQDMSAIAAEIDSLRKPTAVVTECEFRPRIGTAGYVCGMGPGGAVITDGNNGGMVGPLHVPQGATITGVDIFVTDTSPTVDLQICMWAPLDSFGSYDMSVPCVTTSGAPGTTKLTIASTAVQGNGEGFELIVSSRDAGNNPVAWPANNMAIRTAYVHYEVP
jgi:hypothetical protein